ncbi:MAG TPA: DUF222 domain-containing protein, partial [Mycobacteriales bacterium]|nr:DUF222 domain-containing protein [Mycobacteriales bacterium]
MFDTSLDGPPGPRLAAALDTTSAAGLGDPDLIDAIAGWERLAAWAAAGQLAALAEFAHRRPRDLLDHPPGHADTGHPGVPEVSEFAVDELAAALRLGRGTAGNRLVTAVELTRLPATTTALRDGVIDLPKARAVIDAVTPLDDTTAQAVEAWVLPRAGTQTAGQLRAALTRAVLEADPAAAQVRHQHAVAGRRITIQPAADGMAELWALLPADTATAVYTRLDHLARTTPAHGRGMDARRADALLTLALTPGTATTRDPGAGGTSAGTGRAGPDGGADTDTDTDASAPASDDAPAVPGALVHVTVPAATLAGDCEQPGELAGYGPIPASMARRLAADGRCRRILTDPATGTIIHIAPTAGYTPTAALARLVRARDRTCRFPGCRQPAHRCDLDHVTPWPAGPTSGANLFALCRHHHRLKHHTGWHV